MKFPRVTGLTLVTIGALGMVVGLILPWARTGPAHPDGSTIAGLALLGPLLSLARLAYGRFDATRNATPGRLSAAADATAGRTPTAGRKTQPGAGSATPPTAAAAIAAFAAAGLAGVVAQQVDPALGVGLGGPVTIGGALTMVVGWLMVIVNRPNAVPWPGIVLAVVVALVLALDGTGVYWFVEGRFVDAHASGAPKAPHGAPTLKGQRWQRSTPGITLVGVTATETITRDDHGVRAFATGTGAPTWRYQRSDAVALTAGVVGDEVLTVFSSTEGLLITAHDSATGEERFSRRYTGKNWNPGKVVSTSDGKLAVLAGSGPDPGDVVGLDARNGAVRWTWSPVRDGGACDVNGAATDTPTGQLAIALRCRATGVRDLVVALSTSDGKEKWTWPADYNGVTRGDEPTVVGAGAGFLVQYGTAPRHSIRLDDTGAGVKHAGPGGLAAVTPSVAVYYTTDFNGGQLTAIGIADGKQRWQTPLPWLIGWQLVGGTTADADARTATSAGVGGDPGATKSVYVLLTTQQPESAGGPLRLLALNATNGTVLGDDSALSCGVSCLTSQLAADQASVVVATRIHRTADLTLTAPA